MNGLNGVSLNGQAQVGARTGAGEPSNLQVIGRVAKSALAKLGRIALIGGIAVAGLALVTASLPLALSLVAAAGVTLVFAGILGSCCSGSSLPARTYRPSVNVYQAGRPVGVPLPMRPSPQRHPVGVPSFSGPQVPPRHPVGGRQHPLNPHVPPRQPGFTPGGLHAEVGARKRR